MRLIQHLTIALPILLLPALALAADPTPPATGNTTAPSTPQPLPTEPAKPTDQGEEVITLEEFTVTGQSMKDAYIVSEATTGTRLGGNIVDLPYNVQVLTEEFAQDFLLNDNDLMAFVAGATVTGGFDTDEGTITIRGFSSISFRDGFRLITAMKSPMTNSKTEVMKGPASIVYGRTSPGGIVNSISYKPLTKENYLVQGTYGKYGDYYVGARATGPIINNKLYYAASLEYWEKGSPIDFDWANTTQLHATLLYKPTPNISLSLIADYKPYRASASPGSGPGTYYYKGGTLALDERGQPNPYATVSGTDKAIRGIGIFPYFNIQGPDTSNDIDRYSLMFLYEQRFNRNMSFRLAALDYYGSLDSRYWEGGNQYFEVRNGILGNASALRQPNIKHETDKYYAAQAELLTKFNTGPVSHKILLLGDYGLRNYVYQSSRLPDSEFAKLRPSTMYINIYNPDWGLDTDWSTIDTDWNRHRDFDDPSDDLFRDRHNRDESYGLTGSWAGSFFKGRTMLMGSARYDSVKLHQTEPDIKPRDNAHGDFSDISYSLCFVGKIIPEKLQFYMNYSTSYNDTANTLAIDNVTGNFVPPTSSIGYEAGIKGTNLLNNRLSYTLCVAKIRQDNVKVDNPDYTNAQGSEPQYLGTGSNKALAIELSTTWMLSPGLVLLLGGGYTDSEVVSNTMTWIIGDPVKGSSKWDASAAIRYDFPKRSSLEGLRIGLAAAYRSDFISVYETTTYYQGTVDAYTLFNAFISYKWANGPKNRYKSTLQLNCNNVLDKNFITYTGRWYNYGRTFGLSYKLNF